MIEIKRVILTLLCVFSITAIPVQAFDNNEFMPYIKSCSYIRQYSVENDIHTLVVDVLNNHHNFRSLSPLTPDSTKTGALKMCNAEYVDDIIHKTFRISVPRPAPEKLTELGYYYNNGFYYYIDRPALYSVTVKDITKVIPLDDGGVYVIYTDTFTSDDTSTTEYSSIKFYRDSLGWYVKSIHTGLDFSSLSEHLTTTEAVTPYLELVWNTLPLLVFIITIAVVIIIFCKFILF